MNMLKANSFDEAITALFGAERQIIGEHPVYGGYNNGFYKLSFTDGLIVFMKCGTLNALSSLEEEAKGLEALRKTNTIGVPGVCGIGTIETRGISFLMTEYLEEARRVSRYWEVAGRELAELHRADVYHLSIIDRKLPFGFGSDNYIGASPQINTPKADWITFFRDCRLLPQMEMAEGYFDVKARKQCAKLLDHLDDYLTEPERPSLIHGDLWCGNVVCGPDGKAWILDPAAYVGHYEAELAMTELFGGFPESFYRAYHEVNRIDSGYRGRRDLYNLYHLLNHLNLYGRSYQSSVLRILNRYV